MAKSEAKTVGIVDTEEALTAKIAERYLRIRKSHP